MTGCSMGVPKWRLDDLAHKIAFSPEFLSTLLIPMAFLLFLFFVVKHTERWRKPFFVGINVIWYRRWKYTWYETAHFTKASLRSLCILLFLYAFDRPRLLLLASLLQHVLLLFGLLFNNCQRFEKKNRLAVVQINTFR